MIVWVLKTCDTCRKALKWLGENGIDHTPRDVRADGLDHDTAQKIIAAVGVERAVNKRSTTWRNLPDDAKADISEEKAAALLVQEPTLLKRPVFMSENSILVGFDNQTEAALKG